MKSAIFSSTVSPKDGYGNITYELTRFLSEKGVDITLFLPESQKESANELSLPFEVRYELPEYIFRLYQPKALKFWKRINVSEFDLVHSLFAFPYCMIAMRSAKKYKKPFIMGAQGTHGVRPLTYFPEKLVLKKCYSQAKKITVPSLFTKQMIEKHSGHGHSRSAVAGKTYPIEVIHNGVNFERFQKPQVKLDKYRGKIVLLTVGGLWGRKGHDIVLKALSKVIQKRKDVHYVMVGEGNGRGQLEKLTDQLGLQDHVEFAGRQMADDLVSYYQACDIYVHTPKIVDLKFEGFGIVYLEASACGKPIVATDAGGIKDAVIDSQTGLIADDGDIDGVADRILRLCEDEDLRRKLGLAGREYAEKNSWSSIAEKFESLYRSVNV
ncbi:MAG: glycosyltransferase family 4 protein [Candidatus Peribacteraceae bacterium]|jgi:glycosyltransferase involved in cell wall biosynthesis|nr:glycosyltransferase family 4 protein [Candidatus Peribacteraceae bacterium]MDP7454632.1 glycosyltransferase family 4 protein [Candidatus Peribacteraceae bacterium]MDP7645827.1 glycosyltransferase family 4 protein [Candidatus Peribacteraceae bacterium]